MFICADFLSLFSERKKRSVRCLMMLYGKNILDKITNKKNLINSDKQYINK